MVLHAGDKEEDAARSELIAAIPPTLFGVAMMVTILIIFPLDGLVIGGASRSVLRGGINVLRLGAGAAVSGAAVLALVVGSLLGAWRRLPRWSYTWVGAATWAVAFALAVAGEDKPVLISPWADTLIIIGLLVVIVAPVIVAAARGWQDAALVGLGMATNTSLNIIASMTAGPFNRVDIALACGPVGLLYSALILWFIRGDTRVKAVSLALVALLGGGVILVAYAVWRDWLIGHGQQWWQPLIFLAQIWGSLVAGLVLNRIASGLRLIPRQT
jgi:hypothetical protein